MAAPLIHSPTPNCTLALLSICPLFFFLQLVFASFIYFAERGSFNRITGVWERKTGLRCPITCTDAVLAKSWTEPHTYGPCQPSADGTQVSVAFLPNVSAPFAAHKLFF
jgi:hypothetical protein